MKTISNKKNISKAVKIKILITRDMSDASHALLFSWLCVKMVVVAGCK